jgi:hypothetical protein
VEIAGMLQGAIGIGLDAAKCLDEGLNKLTVIRHNASSAIRAPTLLTLCRPLKLGFIGPRAIIEGPSAPHG